MKLIIIVGLSASGKSHLAKEKARENNCTHISDVTLNSSERRQTVKDRLQRDGNLVIDTACCNPTYGGHLPEFLTDLKSYFPAISVETLYFERNPLQCIKNALADPQRQNGAAGALERIRQICRDEADYVIPADHTPIPCFVAQ